MTAARWPVRAAGATGALWGLAILGRGRTIWSVVAQEPPTPVDQLAIDALGLRHVGQGLVQAVAPTRLRGVFVGIDLIHVLTMLPVVVADKRRRRAAGLSCAVALGSAATTLFAGGSRGVRPG